MMQRSSGRGAGWVMFASVMLLIGGAFQLIAGITAIVEDDFYVRTRKWVFEFDVTAWGWIHLLIGAVLLISAFGILSGNLAARIVAVFVAAISAIANFAFLPYYPVWAITVIAIDVMVIWALAVYGTDPEPAS